MMKLKGEIPMMSEIPRKSHKKSLSAYIERKFIEEAQEGDNRSLEKLLQANWTKIVNIVARFVKKDRRKRDLFKEDELVQEARIAFVGAVSRFDLSHRYRFWNFARRIIEAHIAKVMSCTLEDVMVAERESIMESLTKLVDDPEHRDVMIPDLDALSKTFLVFYEVGK